jgi:hypothetical protein
MPILTAIDLLGIQEYVFASNRLRDVLCASWMVEHVTQRASLERIGQSKPQILLSAGGNAVVEFSTMEQARTWTARYTRWLHDTAPGIEAVIAHQPYDGRSLAWGLKGLQLAVATTKLGRLQSAAQLGLSVTAACAITGLPATDVDQGELVSPQVRSLRAKRDPAKARWHKFLPAELPLYPNCKAEFPDELDEMGRSYGETSLLGIVHIDGNGIGQAIAGWLDRCVEAEVNDSQVRAEYQKWSQELVALGDGVLGAVVRRVAQAVHRDARHVDRWALRGTPDELGFLLSRGEGGAVRLPIRPILLGGDDLTFVCDGRIALDSAATALREFQLHSISHLGYHGSPATLSACAGVALTRPHAPFHRGYQLAAALCSSAKQARRKHNPATGSWLDWHTGGIRPGESVAEIRDRQYLRGTRSLTMRPYPLEAVDGRAQSWGWLDHELLGPGITAETEKRGFRGDSSWVESRGRVASLGSLITSGPEEVKRQVVTWQAIEPTLQLPGSVPPDGFIGSATPLLDAIELVDLHFCLDPDPRNANTESDPQ